MGSCLSQMKGKQLPRIWTQVAGSISREDNIILSMPPTIILKLPCEWSLEYDNCISHAQPKSVTLVWR